MSFRAELRLRSSGPEQLRVLLGALSAGAGIDAPGDRRYTAVRTEDSGECGVGDVNGEVG